MARGKKSSTLGRNEFIFSGRKHQVAIPETNLCVLKNDHRDQKRIVIQACWSSFRIFHSYNAIIDPTVDCLALVKKSIATKAAKYQVADIIPLGGWKDGAMIFSGLRMGSQELEDVPMLVADLDCGCDIVLGRRWVEEFGNGWLEELDPRMRPECSNDAKPEHSHDASSSENSTDTEEAPHGQLEGGSLVRFNDSESQRLVDRPSVKKILDREDVAMILLSRTHDTEELDELSGEQNDEDPCRSRIAISVRLPMNDFRISRLSDDDLAVATPAPVTTTSKNQIVVDEDMIAVGSMVVRLPGRQDLELSLSSSPSPSDVQKAKEDTEGIDTKWACLCLLSGDPVEETCLAETAWNEELDDCRNESHDSQISVDSGIDHEDRNRDVCNDISDSKQNGPKDVTQEESQSLDLNILGDAPDDKANDFGHRSQLDVQTGIVDGPYSFNLLECAYDPGVCLPFGSTPEKDIRIHLMDGIGCQLVDPAYQLVISPTCPGGMKIIFFNDISPDTGWCRFPIDSSYTFSEGAWNFGNYDNASDCEGDKLDTQIEVASQFMWMPGCDTLSNLVSLVFFWFDTGWYLTIDGMF